MQILGQLSAPRARICLSLIAACCPQRRSITEIKVGETRNDFRMGPGLRGKPQRCWLRALTVQPVLL